MGHIVTIAMTLAAGLAASQAHADDLTKLSLEELLSIEVTSVAKRPQLADEAAAALFVITQEDIRKTGAKTIPELLRVVPGLEVASIDANNTAVSARGFNWRFSNKLLVLVDGRAVYQSLWSGVLWDQQLTPVEDIERIEVVRGPGATLYGANAVNGVINIVTKHAADTIGGLADLQGGVTTAAGQGFGRFFARRGGRLGERGAFRLYVTGNDTPSLVDANADPFNAGGRALQTGFRTDWEPNDRDAFTLQGDYQTLDFEVTLTSTDLFNLTTPSEGTSEQEGEGFNVLGRWTRTWSRNNSLTVQTYYDRTMRLEFDVMTQESTFDVDISHYFSWNRQIETIWGLGYRSVDDEAVSTGIINFREPAFNAHLFSAFVQQDAFFFNKRLRLSAGSKFEHNDFTGFEVQPSFRGIWVGDDWSLWAAVSRAVRTPSRFEASLAVDLGALDSDLAAGRPLPVELSLSGGFDLEAEDLLAFEVGFRKSWGGWGALDVTGYSHRYDDLFEIVRDAPELRFAPIGPGGAPAPVALLQPLLIANAGRAEIHGVEAALQLHPADDWTVKVSADVKDIRFPSPGISDTGLTRLFQGDTPQYQFSIRSDFDAASNLTTTLWLRRVGALIQSETEGYTDLDFRAGYRLSPRAEITLLTENLLGRRREFPSELYPAPFGFVERKISVSASVRF